jgi:hypothetical protein
VVTVEKRDLPVRTGGVHEDSFGVERALGPQERQDRQSRHAVVASLAAGLAARPECGAVAIEMVGAPAAVLVLMSRQPEQRRNHGVRRRASFQRFRGRVDRPLIARAGGKASVALHHARDRLMTLEARIDSFEGRAASLDDVAGRRRHLDHIERLETNLVSADRRSAVPVAAIG